MTKETKTKAKLAKKENVENIYLHWSDTIYDKAGHLGCYKKCGIWHMTPKGNVT